MHGVAVALPSQEWPAGQAEHSRLTDAVGATVSCCVDEHVATGAHSLPLLWGENVCPAVHGVHVRSDVAEAGSASNSSGGRGTGSEPSAVRHAGPYVLFWTGCVSGKKAQLEKQRPPYRKLPS